MVSEALRDLGGRVVVASRFGDVLPMLELHRPRLRWVILDRDSLGEAEVQMKDAGFVPGNCRVILLGGQGAGGAGTVQLSRPFEREQLVQAVRG